MLRQELVNEIDPCFVVELRTAVRATMDDLQSSSQSKVFIAAVEFVRLIIGTCGSASP